MRKIDMLDNVPETGDGYRSWAKRHGVVRIVGEPWEGREFHFWHPCCAKIVSLDPGEMVTTMHPMWERHGHAEGCPTGSPPLVTAAATDALEVSFDIFT